MKKSINGNYYNIVLSWYQMNSQALVTEVHQKVIGILARENYLVSFSSKVQIDSVAAAVERLETLDEGPKTYRPRLSTTSCTIHRFQEYFLPRAATRQYLVYHCSRNS